MSWSTSELRVRLAPWNRFSPPVRYFTDRSKVVLLLWIFYPFFFLCLLCLCARLFICALWSPAGKGLTAWLAFVVHNCEFITFRLVSWVRFGTWLYRFLIFAPLLTSPEMNCVVPPTRLIPSVLTNKNIYRRGSVYLSFCTFLSYFKRLDVLGKKKSKKQSFKSDTVLYAMGLQTIFF